jgi:hypothetical protein
MSARSGAHRATGNHAYHQPTRSALPGCGRGRPRSQGMPRQSQTWRCARPRARSPPGDGEPCLSPAYAQRAPRECPANPRPGDALVPERGAHRATGNHAHPSHQSALPPDAGGDARAPRECPANPTVGDALVPERGAHRATGNHAYHQPQRNGSPDAGEDARAPREALPIPDLEMRPSPSAEPTGRRGTMPTPATNLRSPQMRARTPALPGNAPPIPRLERRPAPSAEPTGRRGTMPTPATNLRSPQMRARAPALPGGAHLSDGPAFSRTRAILLDDSRPRVRNHPWNEPAISFAVCCW